MKHTNRQGSLNDDLLWRDGYYSVCEVFMVLVTTYRDLEGGLERREVRHDCSYDKRKVRRYEVVGQVESIEMVSYGGDHYQPRTMRGSPSVI